MTAKRILSGFLLVLGLLALAIGSNSTLDQLGIAEEAGLTVQQQKSKAARNQQEWDHYKPTR